MTDKMRAYLEALANLMEEHGAEHSPEEGPVVDIRIETFAVQWYDSMNAKKLRKELAKL